MTIEAKALSDPLGEGRFARAELTVQQDNVAGREEPAEMSSQPPRLLYAMTDNVQTSPCCHSCVVILSSIKYLARNM